MDMDEEDEDDESHTINGKNTLYTVANEEILIFYTINTPYMITLTSLYTVNETRNYALAVEDVIGQVGSSPVGVKVLLSYFHN